MNTTEKLPEDFKAKWVAALRSGEYKQGKNLLHCNGFFCCLGVAYNLAVSELPPDGYFYIPAGSDNHPNVKIHNVPEVLRGSVGVAGTLSEMNDGAGLFSDNPKSFPEIADWIEKHL